MLITHSLLCHLYQMLITHSLLIMSSVTDVFIMSPVTEVDQQQLAHYVTCTCYRCYSLSACSLCHLLQMLNTLSLFIMSPVYVADAVFGSSLQHLCDRDRSVVPNFILECITAVENKGTFCVDCHKVVFVMQFINQCQS